jgi:hypothetical protein
MNSIGARSRLRQSTRNEVLVSQDLRGAQIGERRRVASQRLDVTFESRPGGGDHGISAALVALDPALQLRGVIQRPWMRTMVLMSVSFE